MKIIKCVMVGDGAAGKTYAAEAYRKKCFPQYLGYVPTVYESFRLNMKIGSEEVIFYVYDTAGQEDYDRLRPLDYGGADVVLFWFNVTEPPSYDNVLEKWYPEINQFCKDAAFVVVGSQIDMRSDPRTLEYLKATRQSVLTKNDGIKLAAKINAETYLECSSKTLVGIDNVFETAASIGLALRNTKGNDSEACGIDPALIRLIKTSSEMFSEVLKLGIEENYDIRVMVVGQEAVGKSTLTRRILKLPVKIEDYNSTNGIEVYIHSCHINHDTGKWEYENPGLVSNITRILQKRKKKHEYKSKTAEKRGCRDFHKRCARLLQNFQDAEETYYNFRLAMHKLSLASLEESKKKEPTTKNTEKREMPQSLKEMENVSPEAVEPPPKVIRKPNTIGQKDVEEAIQTAKNMKAVKYNYTSKVSFYDFAGQDIFHATHPTFQSPKSIYILVFNLGKIYRYSKEIGRHEIRSMKYFGDCRGAGIGEIVFIFYWLNVIYMSALQKRECSPHVIFVGTHRDEIPLEDRAEIIDHCFKLVRREIADTPLKDIISPVEIAVDNTRKKDDSYVRLKKEILRLARLQPHWGEKTPTKWLPLGREIQLLKEDGLKILSMAELQELNDGLDVKITDEQELEMFLQFLHDTGEAIWFSEETLKKFVVLDPVWLIDALKLIITAERFALKIPKLAERWETFVQTGVIERSTIAFIFEESKDPALFENHEHVLLLMEKFLFIASPVIPTQEATESKNTEILAGADVVQQTPKGNIKNPSKEAYEKETEEIWYILPSMVHRVADCNTLLASDDIGKSSLLCMVMENHFLPPAVFQKVLAVCIKEWPILEHRGQKCLYSGLCRFNIDSSKNYKLLIFLVGFAIHARVETYVSKAHPPAEICSRIRKFLVQTLQGVLSRMGFSVEFRTCVQCPRFDPLENGGYLDIAHCKSVDVVTCDDCKTSHSVQITELLDHWLDKTQSQEANTDSSALVAAQMHVHDLAIKNDETPKLDKVELNSTDVDSGNEAPKNGTIGDTTDASIDNNENEPLQNGAAGGDLKDTAEAKINQDDAPIKQEHINHLRICNVLVSVCAEALREVLLSQVPSGYHNIYDAIKAKRQVLTGMKLLRQEQLALIFPDPKNTGTVDQFDVTLLYALIRNASSVQPPSNGWGRPPDDNPRDTSLGANVERIRMSRNNISGHSADGQLDDQCFETYWKEIEEILDDIESVIGDKGFKEALEKRKKQVISPQEAHLMKAKFRSYQSHIQEDLQPIVEAWENLGDKLKKLQIDVDTEV